MELLVIFGALWTKQGTWMLSGTGGSGFKNTILLPLLTSYGYQGLNDEVIEEGNLSFSRCIAKVASTRGQVTVMAIFGESGFQFADAFAQHPHLLSQGAILLSQLFQLFVFGHACTLLACSLLCKPLVLLVSHEKD
jgi:hypothetical protein